ncbi:MAG: OmpA family protein [Gammaproteobacteria bacterium]|nr:OmpA family protein [Gammaproteobacteria bacterium]
MADEEDECECPACEDGLPPWLATFADLMSLLMCFFVLLLTFSQIDAQRFKAAAGSLSKAFGVQRQVRENFSPMGTSIIAQEFSPGKPEPTPVDEVKQSTTTDAPNLDLRPPVESETVAEKQAENMEKQLKESLKDEIKEGMVEIERKDNNVIIRIKERGSFDSGTADLKASFNPVMKRIIDELVNTPGRIAIAGHTDDIPIATARFRSNWELSAARAVSVVETLTRDGRLRRENMEVKGLADTKPLEPNNSPENRAKNRRVELMVTPFGSSEAGGTAGVKVPGLEESFIGVLR